MQSGQSQWPSVPDSGNLPILCPVFPGGSDGKESACNSGDPGSIPGSERSPGEGTATHSSILAWRILWTEEPGGLQSVGRKESDKTEQLTQLGSINAGIR